MWPESLQAGVTGPILGPLGSWPWPHPQAHSGLVHPVPLLQALPHSYTPRDWGQVGAGRDRMFPTEGGV